MSLAMPLIERKMLELFSVIFRKLSAGQKLARGGKKPKNTATRPITRLTLGQ